MSRIPESSTAGSVATMEESLASPSLPADGKIALRALEKHLRKLPRESTILTRPGRSVDSWEHWLFGPSQEPELLPSETVLPNHCTRILCLPSSTLFAWPLWVASEGESLDLVSLELSGRHLLKKGMEASLGILPILRSEDRQLLLAVAPEEPFPEDLMPLGWTSSTRFELPARLLDGSLDHDLILWEEWGGLQMAFYRNQNPIWFCGTHTQDLKGLIHRISLRLLAEGVLPQLPASIYLQGIPEGTAHRYTSSLAEIFPRARISHSETANPPPKLRDIPFDLPPAAAKEERKRTTQRQKLFTIAIIGVVLYLLLLLWGAGDLFIRQTTLRRLRREIATVEQPALDAQQQSSRWHIFRPVVDPSTYALDLLAAVAAPTAGGKVRLTLFSLEQGHLHLSGEAGDVTQAYSVIEQLKKNPLLQAYDWNTSQPQLAGKNSVKFDMEGTLPDASQKTDSPSENQNGQ